MQKILFLCTGNSARSIMAECLLNHLGQGRWRAWSAGSHPVGKPNPQALITLAENEVPALSGEGGVPSSKSWDVFTAADAPVMDFIITVCDAAAAEVCPVWPIDSAGRRPAILHWGFPDPAATRIPETDRPAAFQNCFDDIRHAIMKWMGEQEG